MSCPVITCRGLGSHHHHVTAGTVLADPCRCARTETSSAPSTAELLDFAAAHPGRFTGHVEEAIRQDLGITPARYYQLLHRAIQTREALEHDPQTTHKLRREAEQQARTRAARTLHY